MAFPTYNAMLEPLLRVLADAPDGVPAPRAQQLVADRLGLSAEDRLLRVPSGTQLLFRHRANWAHDRLKRAGLSSCPRQGVWQLTSKGLDLVRQHAHAFTANELRDLSKAGRDVSMGTASDAESSAPISVAT